MRTTLLRASVVACIALTPAQMMLAQDVPDVSALEIGDGPVATDALPVMAAGAALVTGGRAGGV